MEFSEAEELVVLSAMQQRRLKAEKGRQQSSSLCPSTAAPRGPSLPDSCHAEGHLDSLGQEAGLELRWRARGKAGGAATLGMNKKTNKNKTERVRPAFLAVDKLDAHRAPTSGCRRRTLFEQSVLMTALLCYRVFLFLKATSA